MSISVIDGSGWVLHLEGIGHSLQFPLLLLQILSYFVWR